MSADITINDFIAEKNGQKHLFTAGPASLVSENILGLEGCFGRGDDSYSEIETRVLQKLKGMSGHLHLARFQGSGSFALEIMISNFAYGKVLVIDSGYYAQRAQLIAEQAASSYSYINSVKCIRWDKLEDLHGNFDWIIACYTETSIGLKLNMGELRFAADKVGAKLMIDATASIGLEDGHSMADTISYSSCKGLFGLTGAGFVAFNDTPKNELPSFNLSITNHLEKKMTGPYHAICSLDLILEQYEHFKSAVINNKIYFMQKFDSKLVFPKKLQPALCTRVSGTITGLTPKVILYQPRTLAPNESVVCHLGEVHLGANAHGSINDLLSF